MTFPFVGTHTAAEWTKWRRTNADVTDDGVVVATDPLPGYGAPARLGGALDDIDAVDVAVDGCGTAYVLATDGGVYRYDPRQDRGERLTCVWNPDDGGVPTGIAVDEDTLYVLDAGTGRVQALSVHLLATRWTVDGFADPVGLTTAHGEVYVLDAGDPDASLTSASGRLVRLAPDGTTETVVRLLYNPIDVASDTAGTVYVLGRRPSDDPVVKLFEPSNLTPTGETGATADVRIPASAFTVEGTGTPFVPTCLEAIGPGELVVGVAADAGGEPTLLQFRPGTQTFERLSTLSDGVVALQSGRATDPARDPALYVVDGTDRAVHRLEPVRRTRRNEATGRYDAQVVRRFDAGEVGTEWHRVTTDLELGDSRTQLRLEYAATDDDWQPPAADADPEAPPETVDGIGPAYAARLEDVGVTDLAGLVELSPGRLALVLGTEQHSVSLHDAATLLDRARDALAPGTDVSRLEWHALDRPNPEDALLDDAEGRYLWVRLTLVGSDSTSPRVGRFRAYFPRRSYLRYLPSVYREDRQSAAFLERYLSLFESTYTDVEEEIGSVSRFLDPAGVPSAHLSWLGSWLAVEADDTWSARATRELIARAPELYRKRGTAEGLLAMIRLYLDHPTPADGARQRGVGRDSTAGSDGSTGASVTDIDRVGSTGAEVSMGVGTGGREGSEERTATDHDGAGGDGEPADRAVYLLEHGDLSCIEEPAVATLYSRLISCPSGFLVLLHPDVGDEQARTVERIVDTQQPAHATGRAVHLRSWFMLNGDGTEETDRGFHTYLGVNSRLTSREFRLGEAGLGQDSGLVEREPDGHLELQSRLDHDARIS